MGFSDLPPELQIQILSNLDRPNLKTVRAVSKKFRDHASPSLFNSTVACARYHALSAMQRISLHPIYPTYVKSIIFDGSVYDGGLAKNDIFYQTQVDRFDEGSGGFLWEKRTRWKRYQELYREQEEMRIGGILLAEVSRALEEMKSITSLIFSPSPRHIPIERKYMKDLLPRGVLGGLMSGSADSFIDSNQRGIHHVIGAIYASQYTGIHEFHIQAPDPESSNTEFTIYAFDFPQVEHLDAGRFFFRQLRKLKMSLSLRFPHPRRFPTVNPPNFVPFLAQPNGIPAQPHGITGLGQPSVVLDEGVTQLSNLAILLSEAKYLRELSLHLTHWDPSMYRMYGHLSRNVHPIFTHLGLDGTWTRLRTISLGGIYASEEDLIQLIKRHLNTLQELEFNYCSLISGSWVNIVDEVLYKTHICLFSLHKVNETVIGKVEFRNMPLEERENWQYEGTLMVNSEGRRHFDEPDGKTLYSRQSGSAMKG